MKRLAILAMLVIGCGAQTGPTSAPPASPSAALTTAGPSPTASPTPAPTPSPTATPTAQPTPDTTPTPTASPTPTPDITLSKSSKTLKTWTTRGEFDFTIKYGRYANVDLRYSFDCGSGEREDFVIVDRDSNEFLVDDIGHSGKGSVSLVEDYYDPEIGVDGDIYSPGARQRLRVIAVPWCHYTIKAVGSYPVPNDYPFDDAGPIV